jgi:AraC-like DNA-binding protein
MPRQNIMRDKDTDGISFDTDALPEHDRFPAFCEGMFRHVIGADIVQRGSMPFRGSLEARHAGTVIIADIATTPSDIVRRTAHMADGNDAVVFLLWQQGLGHVTQGNWENRIDTSNALMIDNARTGRVRAEDTSRFWGLTIPRSRFAGLAPNLDRLIGSKLQDSEQSLRLLSGYLTFAHGLDDPPTARLFGDHLVDLVSLALASEGNAHGLEERGGIRAARLVAILRAISSQLTDPNLSAATIATQLGITPRYVHLLLEQSGKSFTRHVLQRRLEKAEQRLRDDNGHHRKIADIALEAGFSDLSYFNRAFRRHFGDTPSGIRANGGRRRIER